MRATVPVSASLALAFLAIGGGLGAGACSSGGAPSADGGGGVPPLVGTVALTVAGARDIPPFAFGQNYWNWEPTWGNAVAGTEALVAAAGVRLVRAGGANNETQTPDRFTTAELDRFAAYVAAAGVEPVLQVSLTKNAAGDPATVADAAEMVRYANVTKGYGIKHWSIGNEPDLYTEQGLQPAGYTAADYCATFRTYAAAMKEVDPSIVLLGPELSWKYISGNDWLTPFLDGCGDVVDVVSVHRYPFAPTETTVAAAFADPARFRQVVRALRANLDRHGLTGTPLAITEEHITYDGDPAKSTRPASPQTFHAGLWVADVMGVALEEGLWTSAFWHIADASDGWKLGFILGGTPQPTYHAQQLVAAHFSGRILRPRSHPGRVRGARQPRRRRRADRGPRHQPDHGRRAPGHHRRRQRRRRAHVARRVALARAVHRRHRRAAGDPLHEGPRRRERPAGRDPLKTPP